MNALNYKSATSLVSDYASREISPVEVAQAILDQIDQYDGSLKAYCLVDAPAALANAKQSEERWRRGVPQGPLDGVPCSIKDVCLVEGWPTRKGSRLTDPDLLATEDSPAVARLKEAGAILIGKTALPELGWKATSDSPLTGSTLNPWSPAHTSGGSSAGAAVSLAAGMAALAVGSDGGGSIRIPASFCGVVGIKPTQGLVPNYPRNAMGHLSHCGPMARDIQDLALMLNVLSRTDARDPYRGAPREVDYLHELGAGVGGLRIGYSPRLGYLNVHPEVEVSLNAAAERFARLGATVEQVDPGFSSPHEHFKVLWKAGAGYMVNQMDNMRSGLVDVGLRAAADQGLQLSAQDVMAAEAARIRLGEVMGRFHQRFDLLLTPTVAVPALPIGAELYDPTVEKEWTDWAGFSNPFNLTCQPAVSIPCGFTTGGLPIGLQLVGALHEDALVLRAARAFELDAKWNCRPDLAIFC
jgi:aspartyl-tRNA(Asn)/glutamyl-tRNA(Gln) amidotransferase subunit A